MSGLGPRPVRGSALVVEHLLDGSRLTRVGGRLIGCAGIAAALLLIWALVYITNGTSNPFLHAMYVPIIAASLLLGFRGGLATAAAAAVLVGPLMPLNVELGLAQPVLNTIYRGAFFVIVAASTAAFADIGRRRMRQLEESRSNIADVLSRNLRVFARLVAERDEQTGSHCERVAANAVTVGRALDLTAHEERTAYWAGILHDLGKLGVSEAILRKPGRLTTAEFTEMKAHPTFGARILLDISHEFDEIAAAVHTHHERWDGTGYPKGLSGADIPLMGRILAVVDVFEAVTSHRPYRGPMSREDARRMIREGSGTHFDPRVTEAFLRLEENGAIVVAAKPPPAYQPKAIIPTDSGEYRSPAFSN